MLKEELLQKYKKDVKLLKKSAKDLGLSDKDINKVFKKCFNDIKNSTNSSKQINKQTKAQQLFRTVINVFLLFTLVIIFLYILLNVHQPTSSIVLRNVQGLTYPTLKIVRFLSVPIIKMVPSLTDLYDETCLLENPYFYVADMECWPCESVHAVLDLSEIDQSSFSQGSGTPFIVKTDMDMVTFKTLQHMYNENQEVFNVEARRIKSTNSSIRNLQDLFCNDMGYSASSATHISWRINKMTSARIIRKLFPRPSFITDRSGQSVERFIMIDGAKAKPYTLPNTECSYIFVIQGSGERTIVLKPSMECSKNCRTVSIILKPSYVLWYNWWYWRPISLPTENSTGPSISYINSYC